MDLQGYNITVYVLRGDFITKHGEQICLDFMWTWIIICVNFISALFNLLQLIVLKRLSPVTHYLVIIQHLCFADLFASIIFILRTECSLRLLAYQNIYIRTALSLTDFSVHLKYLILFTACIDRVIALTFPLKYSTCWLVRHSHRLIIFEWLVAMAMNIIRDTVYFESIEIDLAFGATNVHHPVSQMLTLLPMASIMLAIVVLFIWIIVEVCKMGRNSTSSAQLASVLAASRYIITVIVLYVICMAPISACTVYFLEHSHMSMMALCLSVTAYSCYGLLNSLAYFFLNTTIRVELCELLSHCCSQ